MKKFYNINRRKFLELFGCTCCGFLTSSCATVPITDRRQLTIYPESTINAQAAKAYEKLKDMTRGEKVDAESIAKFIESLTLSDEHKKTLLKLSPGSYVGMASNIVDQL